MGKAAEVLEIPATVTARGQTTVPVAVRRMLGLGKSGHIVFRRLADGTITVAKADPPAEEDPALGPFLTLIARDLETRPHAIQPVSEEIYRRAAALVEGIAVDLDEALPSDAG
ncbi:type II toxin-antitoxin system PrlF family antitoxin [Methylobacterium sp. J-026]|uniref:type II toxin-antitoxin system PrlF family antitoxin n=1 Tax=Methylobacterium sp. J-026 TaxID=2836624 RepID=UPI001FB89E02|nr:type II toxin-antitoxin system PrlF family antitoxin [Methylobacterium sp. J-026]MCJ2136116.1 type II toxin-antitoxin system PrlF family antitoxin [Methylobacterium sp. J-026]